MPDKPAPKPEDVPSYEDIEKQWGPDLMSFFHDMVSPDKPEERGEEE